MSATNKALADALRRFVATGRIVADDYSAARGHHLTTPADRKAMSRYMVGHGDKVTVLALACRIAAHPW